MRAVLLVLLLAACGIKGEPEPVADEEPRVSEFEVLESPSLLR